MRYPQLMTLSACLGFVLFGCPKRVGSQAELDPTSREAVAEAKRQAKSGNTDEALKLLRTLPEDNEAVADVLFQVGQTKLDSRDFAGARTSFRDLLTRFPLYEKADLVKCRLGMVQLELKECPDALQTLSAVYTRLPPSDQPDAAIKLARAAECARAWAEAVRWNAEAMRLASDDQLSKAAQQRVIDILESRVSLFDIAKLAEEISPASPFWPLVQLKLGKILAHVRDPRQKEVLQKLLAQAPNSPQATDAKVLLDRAERGSGPVRADTVGIVLPLSGKFQSYGESVMAGIKLAMQNSGVRLVVRDSAGDAAQARAAVATLAQDEQVIAIIGPVLTGESQEAATEAEGQDTPIITLTRAEGVTDIGSNVFRNMLTNSAQAQALAEWAIKAKGYKKFAVLYPNMTYGTELTTYFKKEIEARNGEVRQSEKYEADRTTFGPIVKKIVGKYYLEDGDYEKKRAEIIKTVKDPFRQRKALEKLKKQLHASVDFDALFIPDYHKNIGLLAPSLAVEEIDTNTCKRDDRAKKTRKAKPVQLLGANGWNFNELVKQDGGKFVQCAVFVDGFFGGSNRKETRAFVESFRATNNREPSLLEAEGYDSARILRYVIERQKPVSRAALREALMRVKDFPGATGRTSFNAKREAEKPLFMLTIDGEEIVELQNDISS